MNYESNLPAYPLITSDPYLSVWSAAEHPAQQDTTHWAGARKRMTLSVSVDDAEYALLGAQPLPAAELTGRLVTPTTTKYTYLAAGVELTLSFCAPLLLDDLDLTSMPVTFVELTARSADGAGHAVKAEFVWHDDICRDGDKIQPMLGKSYCSKGMSIAWMGQKRQNLLGHSGDHITIDWGYAYLAADSGTAFERVGGHWGLTLRRALEVGEAVERLPFLLAYDDVASIQYFEYTARAWYARNGRTIIDAIRECAARRGEILARCEGLDGELLAAAKAVGGESYTRIVAAAYRHTICAHKMIADRDGKLVFLSKENDSNGCIGTVDVSYPSIPLYLMYAPELVRGMCRPILRFANMPVWKDAFAPHDVGRYPYATGQVYALRGRKSHGHASAWDSEHCDFIENGDVYPPVYLYDGEESVYDFRYQMPVEECGNMILMLAAAMRADGDDSLVREYLPTLKRWVGYLEEYGEDPGEQLCTDDFAGHLAHNVNLAFKAVCGMAAFGWMMEKLGDGEQAEHYRSASRAMAKKVYDRARTDNGTALTLDGQGWSLKYNMIWDKLFGFGLMDDAFFKAELARYEQEQNEYGVPLDSRREYTKSDWILWVAAMADDAQGVELFCKPIVKYLKETSTRVPFGDWYETKKGTYCHFIARSVQGGLFMPMLRGRWEGRI